MKSVAFEWNSITDPKVQGIYIYKKTLNAEGTSELVYYTTIQSRFSTHYVDTAVKPDTRYTYTFKTFSAIGEGRASREIVVNTLPVIESVSWIHSITGMPRVAKIIWRPHSNQKVKAYVMERKTLEDEKWEKLDTITGRLNAEYIDEELNDNFVYMYRLRAITYDGITSTPSVIVKVVTKALPNPITNLSATTSIANKINLNWDESLQEDFALYYLYRSKEINSGYEVIAKLHNNTFVDKIEANGKTYFYRVSAVDKDTLESEHSKKSIQGMTLSAPEAPSIVKAKRVGNNIEIHWSKTDPRSVSYSVIRSHKKGWFDEVSEEFTQIKGTQFIDKNVEADSTYSYVVYSVDINGIKSDESVRVKIVIPESDEIIQTKSETIEEEPKTQTIEAKKDTIVTASEDLDLSSL
ncbi:Putative fibronectin domain-containing lipoprotein [hydrothermal vent metagenome]|uniref:Putative fibronectin domain-containing lipoprotein n=1 Tax=hydrothermal vent metagenome TaxID=652676 RepID=A0A1W1BRD3_9ZZZZ